MTMQSINIGNRVNDGLGDDLRTAFEKVNANFVSLSESLTITAKNLGNGAKIFKRKTDVGLEFRTIISGGVGIAIEELEDAIAINNTAPPGFRKITGNSGSITSAVEADLIFEGVNNIDVNIEGPKITFDTININNRSYKDILSSFDFGYITGKFDNPIQFSIAISNSDFGTIDLPSNFNFDLGGIVN